MANFYLDTPELKHHLNHPLMNRIVELKERNYADKDKFDYAPVDFEDAMDSYEKSVVTSSLPMQKASIMKARSAPTIV